MADTHGAQDWLPTAAGVGGPLLLAIVAWLAARRKANSEAVKFDAEAIKLDAEARKAEAGALFAFWGRVYLRERDLPARRMALVGANYDERCRVGFAVADSIYV